MISGRGDCRSGKDRCQPANHAEAWYCQGNHAQATRTELAETMDVNPSTLGNWLDPHHASHMPDERRDHLLRLTDDHTAYVRYLSLVQGLVVYDPRDARGQAVTRMVTEFGELLRAVDDATVDGAIDADEALRIEREGTELIAAVHAAIQHAKSTAGLTKDGAP